MTVDIYEESEGRHTHYADVDELTFIPSDGKGNVGFEFVKIFYTDENQCKCIDFVSTNSITRLISKESIEEALKRTRHELAVKTNDNIDE